MRTVALKLSLLLFGLVIAFGIGECTVRIMGIAPDIIHVEKGRYRLSNNKTIGYEPVPGLDYDGASMHFYDYRGAANSLGYRDYEHKRSKPEGRYRVVVIGDSIAAGHHVKENGQMFASVLERGLKARGIDAEVLNFGVSGYNTQQEVETLKVRGLRYQPDLVLVAYCLNDRERNDGGILATLVQEAEGREGVGVDKSWLDNSALFRVLWYRVLEKHKVRPAEYMAGTADDTVAESLDQLGRLAKEQGFAVMVAIFPDLNDLDRYRYDDEHEFVGEIAGRNNFRVLDLLEPFRSCGGNLRRDRYHPNARGHACAGEAMVEAIAPLAGGTP